ncbi:HNH endonuclease signature motif containing protein [Candidatus Poribacteria bacterium]
MSCLRQSTHQWRRVHTHHKKPVKEGGKNSYDNLQLLHLYCHQQIHSMGKRKATIAWRYWNSGS